MRLLVQHRNRYRYPGPAALGPHVIRLRPANHTRARVEAYSLTIGPPEGAAQAPPGDIRWQQDPYGNHVARLTFRAGTRLPELEVTVELALDVRPVNPFDFFVDERCQSLPFPYPPEVARELQPFLGLDDPALLAGERVADFLAGLPRSGPTVPAVVEINRLVSQRVRYVIREEAGIYTPEETLRQGRGSCRDSAALLIVALRSRGLAARFVSGYLIQLTDEGMIPDQPRGVGRDVVDLHAWAEVYLPGAGWIGLDATSGLLCGEGHVPLACTSTPALASPIEGSSDLAAVSVSFEMTLGRLGHEPRPTMPYTDEVWATLGAAGERADQTLAALGVELTVGGEPTFNARDHAELPEWNSAALGPDKARLGRALAAELRARLSPGAAVVRKQGKLYPGESLPRWALEIVGRRDGMAVWQGPVLPPAQGATAADADRLMEGLCRRLGLAGMAQPAYEDPWRFLQEEAALPEDVDPLRADLDASEERRRLARVLDAGLGRPVGQVLPIAADALRAGRWVGEVWRFRRGHLFLLPGDSPIGLRLPLKALPWAAVPLAFEEPFSPPDPRSAADEDDDPEGALSQGRVRQARVDREPGRAAPPMGAPAAIRTALCVEAREGLVHVFLPPLPRVEQFLALLAEVEAAAGEAGVAVQLEGYGPPSSPLLYRLSVTPDPGVLEVNLPPSGSTREHAALLEALFEAALAAGLHCEKYLLDGRMAGSGGGNHITLGGPSALRSPLLARPDLLASLLTFVQHHPSLSYLFTGLFVGPTSQAPRVDEARHDALDELEIALARAFATRDEPPPPPWLADMLFRNLLVDLAGNTHRAEICIDKLFDPAAGPHGRQGLIELRAFEMPPHPRMVLAQVLLVRSLVAAFAREPYRGPLLRHGQALHDRFLLPHYLWADFEDVLGFLAGRGLPLPPEGYLPFLDLRCPVVGQVQAGPVTVEVRNALEPWPVLGEELTAGGTSRFVDSSMERIQVRADGLVPGRHVLLVNHHTLPMAPTGRAGEHVAGVRFRAWAPPHSLHAHLGIHHPVRIDVLDTWARRSLGACAYHVWHPEGRAYDAPPLTRFEAASRRAQRFTIEGQIPYAVAPRRAAANPNAPCTLDLRRLGIDRPMPEPEPEPGAGAAG